MFLWVSKKILRREAREEKKNRSAIRIRGNKHRTDRGGTYGLKK